MAQGPTNSHQALLRNRQYLEGRLLVLGLQDPDLLAGLPAGGLAMSEHQGVCQQARQMAPSSWQVAFGYNDPALQTARADTVVVFLPKARQELDLRLALARAALVDGGKVLVIGEKREGIAGAVKQLRSLDGAAVKLDSARHCQVWQARPAPAPFSLEEWLRWHRVEVAGTAVEVAGLPGIFSDGHLDEGTRLLLEALAARPLPGPVLDFACGAGTIGAWLAGHHGDNFLVDGIDVQAQAVFCARQTYQRQGVAGAIIAADGLPPDLGRYAAVVTNPPFHTGVRTDASMTTQFLQQVSRHLTASGELVLVANRFLPYPELIQSRFRAFEVLAEDSRFRVYRASGPRH
ncbi:MAG: methyltransferase [Marinobacter sp.]|uniref:methyltransferase n=1 Tax=Marinobacter sp. TaxID=50741 RepID=UPI00299DCBFC|nr:methyltransferase [Marinobacter sp.]MDX1633356.1 methyltransferase [Marinobacter sp.]